MSGVRCQWPIDHIIIISIIILLVRRIVQLLNKEIMDDNTIRKGMRRNGMFAWRPCLDNGGVREGGYPGLD